MASAHDRTRSRAVASLVHAVSTVMGRRCFAMPAAEARLLSTMNVRYGFFNRATGYLRRRADNAGGSAIDRAIRTGSGADLTLLSLTHRFGRFHGNQLAAES